MRCGSKLGKISGLCVNIIQKRRKSAYEQCIIIVQQQTTYLNLTLSFCC